MFFELIHFAACHSILAQIQPVITFSIILRFAEDEYYVTHIIAICNLLESLVRYRATNFTDWMINLNIMMPVVNEKDNKWDRVISVC